MPKKTVKRRAQPKSARRRSRGFGFVYAVVSTLAVIGLVLAGVTVFFRLETYEITGITRYTRADIINATGLDKGDNLYFFNKFSVQEEVQRKLPYVGEIRLTRRLPKTLVITVKETTAAAAIEDGGSYVLINSSGKVLERAATPDGAAVVSGVQVTDLRLGEPVVTEVLHQAETLRGLLEVLDTHGLLSKVNSIALNGAFDVTATYMDKIEIRLGLSNVGTERKIRALGKILSELSGDTAGVLDMSGDDYRFVPLMPTATPTPTPGAVQPTPAES